MINLTEISNQITPRSCTFKVPFGIILGMNNHTILLHERVDDIPLLIGMMSELDLGNILNQCIPTHGNHGGIDHGNMAIVWLTFIMSQSDHRKVSVEPWVKSRLLTLQKLLNLSFSEKDFTDDRLSILLKYLSDSGTWDNVESLIWQKSMRVLPPNNGLASVRVDATTVSGYHTIVENCLMQLGNSKAHRPDLGQFKLMSASHQPSGCMIASTVHSGESADDPLYVPIIKRVQGILKMSSGLLFIGDCKMAARATRAHIEQTGDFYLTPLPMTGKTKPLLEGLISYAIEHPGEVQELIGVEEGSRGFESSRMERHEGETQLTEWRERLLVVQTAETAKRARKELEENIVDAEKAIRELTSAPGKGKKVFRTEEELSKSVEAVLEKYGVKPFLDISLKKTETRKTCYVGRGRGSSIRPTIEKVEARFFIADVKRVSGEITKMKKRLGWRIFVTNKPCEALSFSQAIVEYRKGWCLERSFHLLKDEPIGISPLFVQNDDQIKGLTHLLLLANRVLSEIELRVRGSLKAKGESLVGMKIGAPKQETATPTATSLLKKVASEEITLTRIATKEQATYHLTTITPIVQKILGHLGLNSCIYDCLTEIKDL